MTRRRPPRSGRMSRRQSTDSASAPVATATAPPREDPSTRLPSRARRAPGARAVRRQVQRIPSSGDFDASPRSRELLQFIVEEALAGRGGDITQYSIATRVFRRREGFDPTVDPIVRIQAGRLRRSLERYYLLSGRDDTLRVELPRGTYVPAFRMMAETGPPRPDERPPDPAPVPTIGSEWPAIVVRPFEPEGSGPGLPALGARLAEEVASELGRHRDLRPLLEKELDLLGPSRSASVRFSVGGRLRLVDGEPHVAARLVDRATGQQVWADEYHTTPGDERWKGSLEDVARVVAARVGGEEGVVIQLLAGEFRKRRPAVTTPFDAILLSYEYFLARDPKTLQPTLESLRQAVKTDPECGVAWTRLARVQLANYAFELTSLSTSLDEAIRCAQNGVRIDPTCRRARCILAAALVVKGELSSARKELEEALEVSPESLVWLEGIGQFLVLVGDGDRGSALIRDARWRNPYFLPNANMGLWFEHLRRDEIPFAYQSALEFRDPTFFWRGVMRASCLGLLGRGTEAEAEIAGILDGKPDFPARGRTLIGHYVKLPDVFDRVLDGLSRAGLELA